MDSCGAESATLSGLQQAAVMSKALPDEIFCTAESPAARPSQPAEASRGVLAEEQASPAAQPSSSGTPVPQQAAATQSPLANGSASITAADQPPDQAAAQPASLPVPRLTSPHQPAQQAEEAAEAGPSQQAGAEQPATAHRAASNEAKAPSASSAQAVADAIARAAEAAGLPPEAALQDADAGVCGNTRLIRQGLSDPL